MQRTTLSLDGDWDFQFFGDEDVALQDVTEWRTATVPGPWQAQFEDLRDRQGRAWYRRSIELPMDWAGAPVFLRFGAVNYHARVLVNGIEVAAHEGGYLPFEASVGRFLRPGRNEIAVAVTAPTDDPDAYPEFPFAETPFGKQSWYGPLSGIWQSVTMERRAADHVTGLRVVGELADGSVRIAVQLAQPLRRDHDIDLEISGPDGVCASLAAVAAAGQDRVTAEMVVPQVQAWSPESPTLYRLTAILRQDGESVDSRTESFGFRTVETRDGRICLNGRPILLRSALDQDYYPDGICTVPSMEFLEDQFRKAKELGLNCLRCHIKVPDPRYYEAADRIGLLIWTELPNAGRLTEQSARRLRATLQGIVERDGNHPSIICWTIINENWGTDLVHNAEHRAWVNKTYGWLKAFDPTRLVVDNSPLWPSFHVQSDIEDYHFYAAIPDHRGSWDGFVERMANRREATYTHHGDAKRTGQEPVMCSEFGNWGLPDPKTLRGADGKEPWWFETGHDWGEGVMYPHGIETRFTAYGLDRVFGSLERFVEAAQWQQFRALKYQIEAMRRQPALAGYVITEFTDCHWESNGLLDMRRNPRAFHGVFHTINADTVIVPQWDRVAYWEGEEIRVGLAAAQGNGETVTGTELRWTVDAGAVGGSEAMDLEPGVSHGREAVFPAPTVERPELHRLELEIATPDGVLATNHVELAIHPRRTGPSAGPATVWTPEAELADRFAALGYGIAADAAGADVVVARRLDEERCAEVRAGARLVLLADEPQDLQPVFPHFQNVRVVSRHGSMWLGAWASSFSWVKRSGPFARLPGGPLIDHSFDRVIPDHVIANCTTWDFQARVHAGMVVGWVHKPAALIVERNCGHGRMVATTFRLLRDAPGADPTATALLDGLVELALKGRDGVREERVRETAE
ncbi:glycoside hydrolase family 2 protein [Azospirillum thermophilum]|uniref:Glycoside hydrolase family 2 n=1 Tax=Azospirillum thermophilum TaxID=2202148 RepID=A0A2S2CXW7_9PROT|nr:sugar-binding domain-containing protein [Azospirillum thermophilum]AWK89250.1 glycoside hydrolase family 2 [Azospirillum thermophilum]